MLNYLQSCLYSDYISLLCCSKQQNVKTKYVINIKINIRILIVRALTSVWISRFCLAICKTGCLICGDLSLLQLRQAGLMPPWSHYETSLSEREPTPQRRTSSAGRCTIYASTSPRYLHIVCTVRPSVGFDIGNPLQQPFSAAATAQHNVCRNVSSPFGTVWLQLCVRQIPTWNSNARKINDLP